MTEYFPDVPHVEYAGPESDEEFAFDYYDPDREVGGGPMRDQLRFSMAFWHTLVEEGSDPFGAGTMRRPWDSVDDSMERAEARVRAGFEFMEKLGIEYFCFHDRDIAPTGGTLAETNDNLDEVVSLVSSLMDETGIDLLWGTAQLFHEPKYVNGAATAPNADVFAHAGAQVKKALEVTNRLDGDNFVFWGGREGYETLLNTDVERELDNAARLLRMAADYADDIGFDGQLLLEPKPKEPTKHQYDHDVATVLSFLRKYDLDGTFGVNVEANHATLAGHTFQHELRTARVNDALGSVDANRGDELLGWDTDQFPTDVYATTLAMYEILKDGGLAPGGLNFDAKVRRASFEPEDLFYGHIAGMDAFARGLEVAHALLEDGVLEEFVDDRYASYEAGIGARIANGDADLADLEAHALDAGDPTSTVSSGRQERLESVLNRYVLET